MSHEGPVAFTFYRPGRVRARSGIELIYGGSPPGELVRWSYQEKSRGPIPAPGPASKDKEAICRDEAACAERVLVRPAEGVGLDAMPLRDLRAVIAKAEELVKLSGATGLPVLRNIVIDDKSPLWAYRDPRNPIGPFLIEWDSLAEPLEACYKAAKEADPKFGEMSMSHSVILDPSGKVASVSNSPIPPSKNAALVALHGCVDKAIMTLEVPAYDPDLKEKISVGRGLKLPYVKSP